MTDLNPVFFALLAIAIVTLTLLFLPAILELKLPKDAGPRPINVNLAKPTAEDEVLNCSSSKSES